MPTPDDRRLYWGDFHKHVLVGRIDDVIESAKINIDVYPVLCYPFEWNRRGRDAGIREETVGQFPESLEWWEEILDAVERHHDPGEFVAVPGYEWHGNRTRWGDHNVIYFGDDHPLDDTFDLPDLYDNLRGRDAVAIPHHTGFAVGNRGKDWAAYDPDLSPVMEVFSDKGSSEGVDTPFGMEYNQSMGPRTSGGTLVDALDRGHRVGVIASNDGAGLPGSWGDGVAGIWAESLTREGVREALASRRTYGTTGDRIDLWWELDGRPMGDVLEGVADPEAVISVDCPRKLDRVELVHNGQVTETYCHRETYDPRREIDGRCTVLTQFGWGPSDGYGDFDRTALSWDGRIHVDGGELIGVQPRFGGLGQHFEVVDGECRFDLRTDRSQGSKLETQGLILDMEATDGTTVVIELADGGRWETAVSELLGRSRLIARTGRSQTHVEEEFKFAPEAVDNPDLYFHNAPKIKLHPVHRRPACAADVVFEDLPTTEGADYYYVRVSQVDGQYAWSSPIWVE